MTLHFVGPEFKADIVRIKAMNKFPIPTTYELKTILNTLKDYHPYKLAFGLIAIQGLRPKEVANLTWDSFILNNNNTKVEKIRHFVYKPSNRHYHGIMSSMYKQVEKPCFSCWLSDQIIGYSRRYPKYPFNKVFSFSTPDVLHKFFSNLRKEEEKIQKHSFMSRNPFLLDKNVWTLKGQDKTQYRISPYAFRRFAFTFHYHVTFNQDIVSLAKMFGHTKTETTYDHYVYPKKSIGLTDDMANKNVCIDTFIGLGNDKDIALTSFWDKSKEECLSKVEGQRKLSDFALETNRQNLYGQIY